MKKHIFWGLAGLTTLVFLNGCSGSSSSNEAVAKVGNTVLTRDDYLRRMERLNTPISAGGGQMTLVPAGYAAMLQLIREQIVMDKAKAAGLEPTEDEIMKKIEELKKVNPQVKEQLEKRLLTPDDLFQQVKIELTQFKLVTQGVTVTDQDIKKYYEENKNTTFRKAASAYALLISVNKPEMKKKIDDALKGGDTFETIITRYRTNPETGVNVGERDIPLDPSAIQANDPSQAAAVQQLKRVQNFLKTAKLNEVTGWLDLAGGESLKFKVLTRNQARVQPFEEVKEQIREGLKLQKGNEKNKDLVTEIDKSVAEAQVEVLMEKWKVPYQEYLNNLKERTGKETQASAK